MPGNRTGKILVIDDSVTMLAYIGSILKKSEYEFESAINGKVAFEKINAHNFNLILLDVILENETGFEIIKKLRSNLKSKDVPVIFLTQVADKESIATALELGAVDYIAKPFSDRELLARIKTNIEFRFSRDNLENALQESLEFNRALDEMILITIIERNGKILYVNDKFCTISNYSREDLIGQNYQLLKSDYNGKNFIHELNNIILSKSQWNGDIKYYTKDGTFFWVATTITPQFDTDGSIEKFIIIQYDITKHKQTEDSLNKSKRYQEYILNNLLTGIVEINLEGQIIYANQAAVKILDISQDEVTNRYFNERTWHQIDANGNPFPMDKLPLAIAMNEKKVVTNIEHGIMNDDGDNKWLIVNAFPILDAQNNLQGAIANFIDITQRKVSEDLLRESESILSFNEKFVRMVTNSMSGMVAYWNKNLRCTFANERYQEWFGKTTAQMLGIHLRDLIGIETYTKNLPLIERVLRGENIQLENKITKLNGEDGFVLVDYVPHFETETREVLGYIVVVTDITKLKLTEIALSEQKEKADLANLAKSEFLASMSHEIRTPLNGVIGFTDLLMKTELSDTQAQYMGIVYNSAISLLDLLNDILDFSKIEAGKLELANERLDLFELIEQSTDIIKYKAIEKKIVLLKSLSTSLPRFIYGDSIRLRQILVNLLGNAIKFTMSGEIEVKVDYDKTKKGELVVSVRDTGIGISKENLKKIFEAFSQEDVSITRKYGGTGLGLTISNKLLDLMKSKLELESEEGKGSRFYFTLNVQIDEGSDSNSEKKLKDKLDKLESDSNFNKDPEVLLRNVKILVVDDSSVNLFLAKTMLEKLVPNGIIIEASSGEDSIKQYIKELPDLIFMDVQMPIIDGLQATREIRKIEKGRKVPIIALTAGTVKEEIAKCFEAGMSDYASKPIVLNTLKKILSKWLNEKSVIDDIIEKKRI